jgi:hypothetical protein
MRLPPTPAAAAATLPCRPQVLYESARLLGRGAALNHNNYLTRLALAVLLLLLALLLDGALLAVLRPEQLSSAGSLGVLLLLNLALGLGAALSFIMGFVGDSSQVRVLAQARAQLVLQTNRGG